MLTHATDSVYKLKCRDGFTRISENLYNLPLSESNNVEVESLEHSGLKKMPLQFSSDKALKHLLSHGFVYTFRKEEKTRGRVFWLKRKRLGRKIGEAVVTQAYKVFPGDKTLDLFTEASGFDTTQEWVEEIKNLNEGVPETGYVHRVVLVKDGTGL